MTSPAGTPERPRTTALEERLTQGPRTLLREVAHMLRSPLGSIAMLTETLREQGSDLDEAQRERPLGIIYRAAVGIAVTASDLLTLTDGNGSGSFDEVVELSADEVLRPVADIVRPVTEARGCELIVSSQDAPVVGRLRTLRRVMLDLALRAALRARGGEIELAGRPDGDGDVTFSVTARGEGADADGGANELFEILRSEPDDDSYTLSAEGLALAAARQLLSAMGSDLVVEVDPDDTIRLSFVIGGPPPR